MFALWDSFNQWLNAVPKVDLIAFGHSVALLCVIVSARIAPAFLHHNPRLFTVMALFAAVWLCSSGGYVANEPRLSDLITDISSFLEVYIGALLFLEGSSGRNQQAPQTSLLQSVALVLLVALVTPKQLNFSWDWLGPWAPKPGQVKMVTSELLVAAGFASVLVGAWVVAGWIGFVILALILAAYETALFYRVVQLWNDHCTITSEIGCQRPERPPLIIVAYALGKVLYTLTFSIIVVRYATRKARPMARWYWIKRFFFLAPAIPQDAALGEA